MANDLAYPAPTDANANPFVGAVDPPTGRLHPLEGGTTTTIVGSPSGASAVRLVVEAKDGGVATVGALSDAAYTTGSGSVVALLKGIFGKFTGLAQESGGNLAAAKADLDTVAAQTAGLAAGAKVALSSPPSNLTAGADTTLTFSSQVRHVYVQNKSTADVNVAFDATASAGTFLVPGSASALMQFDVPCTVLHAYCGSALAVNGTAGGNLVVEGRA